MHPILFQIGPLTIYTYGAMLALAVVACSLLLYREAKAASLNPEIILDLVFWVAVLGIIGSRVFFVLLNVSYFWEHPLEIVMVHHGGLAWQGGLVFGVVVGLSFIRLKKLPFWKTVDLVVPSVALGQAIGRIGCFFNGCCYGRETPFGIYFPVHQAYLHPTQLYAAISLLTIFLLLKTYQRVPHKQGNIFFVYLLLASLQRFIIQFLRADYDPLFWGIGIFQFVNLLIFFLAIYGMLRLNRR